ncbi:AP-2 complex subunit alpha-2 [Vitis vinifera]|uniref:AP-2 complex subunit alpha-2 n=1 Tax=Vitis vinifera TaxID=29760 RepID=A0A438KGH7_VITVI|nr:AP-2 complex subunit alpha-2 [Vitis vinifera]
MMVQMRIETDPADRTQLRMTVSSGDPTLTFELKEFIKEQLVSIPQLPVHQHLKGRLMKSEKADMFMAYAYVQGGIPMILSNKFLQRYPALPHVASVGLNVKGPVSLHHQRF